MESTAVSVIIPVWNSERYFQKCLDSVIGQSLKHIEIIIVDDASTDRSGRIADEYAARDSRITVLHQKESIGAGPARNAAMSIAKGEYIAFMDSDDLYPSSDVLETLYRNAVEQKANICGGSLYKINAEDNILDKNVPNQFFIREGWYNYREYQYDGGFYRFLYNRKFLKKHNLKFTNYRRFQDAIFFVTSMTEAKYFYAICKYSYAYRKNHKNIVWTYKNVYDHLNALHSILCFSLVHHFNSLHYLMVKNFLDTINYKMTFFMKFYFIKYIIKILKCIDWNIIKNENYNNNVNISFIKILYRFVF